MDSEFQMEDTPKVEDESSELTSENAPQKKQETLEEMLSRHRKEISKLQDKETAMKKAAAKGGKAEQKAKKKQVDEEISKLLAELKEKHAGELSSLGYSGNSNGKEKGNLDNLVKAIAGVSVSSQADHSKPSKSAKRREKRAQQEAAREQRIQEEQSNTYACIRNISRYIQDLSPMWRWERNTNPTMALPHLSQVSYYQTTGMHMDLVNIITRSSPTQLDSYVYITERGFLHWYDH